MERDDDSPGEPGAARRHRCSAVEPSRAPASAAPQPVAAAASSDVARLPVAPAPGAARASAGASAVCATSALPF